MTARSLGRALLAAAVMATAFLGPAQALALGRAADPEAAHMPTWLREHMEHMAGGSGRWITDNRTYQSETEPFDAYGMEWTWGVGEQSLRGRLFGVQAGAEAATFWEFRLVWDPKDRKATIHQYGGDGTVGQGEIQPAEGREDLFLEQQTFHGPGGTWMSRHETTVEGEQILTESYLLRNGEWLKNRSYVWKRDAS